jgi:hypothetical protein
MRRGADIPAGGLRPGLLALALIALPQLAAACPVADDLARGIRFTDAEGVTETFTSDVPGLVTSIYDYHGAISRTLLLRGLYLVEAIEMKDSAPVPASRVTFSFTDPPGGLPDPVPGGGWSGTVTMLTGDTSSTETLAVSFGAAETLVLGDCSYAMVPVRLDYPDRTQPGFEVMTWLPGLGLGFLSAIGHGPETAATLVDRFDYTAIEALP